MNRFKGIPSWAFARQKSIPSGIARFSIFVQSTDQRTLGCFGHHPGLTPDKRASRRVLRGFRNPFSRQISVLSGISDTFLGVRPTEEPSVWYFVVSGIHSVYR